MEPHFKGPHSNDSIAWGLMHIAVTTSSSFFFFYHVRERPIRAEGSLVSVVESSQNTDCNHSA